MNREAVALGTPVYTTYGGRLGGVDEGLIREGRLRPLTTRARSSCGSATGEGERMRRDPGCWSTWCWGRRDDVRAAAPAQRPWRLSPPSRRAEARPHEGETLVERYARMAHELRAARASTWRCARSTWCSPAPRSSLLSPVLALVRRRDAARLGPPGALPRPARGPRRAGVHDVQVPHARRRTPSSGSGRTSARS